MSRWKRARAKRAYLNARIAVACSRTDDLCRSQISSKLSHARILIHLCRNSINMADIHSDGQTYKRSKRNECAILGLNVGQSRHLSKATVSTDGQCIRVLCTHKQQCGHKSSAQTGWQHTGRPLDDRQTGSVQSVHKPTQISAVANTRT
jgi:hypothetical protein